MAERTALSRILLTLENLIENVEDDGQTTRRHFHARILEGLKLESGSDADEVNRAWFETLEITIGGTEDLDLDDLGADLIGLDVRLEEVVTWIVKHGGDAGLLEVQPTQPTGAATWVPTLTVANGGALKPGGFVMLHQPGADALDAGTMRLGAVGATIDADVWVLGRDLELSSSSSSSSSSETAFRSSSSSSTSLSSLSSSSSSSSTSLSSSSTSLSSETTSLSSSSTSGDNSSSTEVGNLFFENTLATFGYSVQCLGNPMLETFYSDGTSNTFAYNGGTVAHTFVPSEARNQSWVAIPIANPITAMNLSSGTTTRVVIPEAASDLNYLSLRNFYVLEPPFVTYGHWTNLTYFRLGAAYLIDNLDTFATWVNLETLDLNSSLAIGSSYTIHPEWVKMKNYLCAFTNYVGAMSIPAEWVLFENLYAYNNAALTSLTVPNTLTAIKEIQVFTTGITSFTTHPEWVNLEWFRVHANAFGASGIVLHPEWVKVEKIEVYSCGLTTLTAHATWPLIDTFYCHKNSLDAATIDAIIIAIDGCGSSNGLLYYNTNPGAADGDRSAAAATAITNLEGRGWTVDR